MAYALHRNNLLTQTKDNKMIKSLSPKISLFATEQDLRDKLTAKEYIALKLSKLDEHITDLLHMTEKTNGELSMTASSKYNYIKSIQEDLLKII
jgi:hypothetical protein